MLEQTIEPRFDAVRLTAVRLDERLQRLFLIVTVEPDLARHGVQAATGEIRLGEHCPVRILEQPVQIVPQTAIGEGALERLLFSLDGIWIDGGHNLHSLPYVEIWPD